MTPFQLFKLARFELQFGKMTSEEALNLALNSEDIKRSLAPFDPAILHFSDEQTHLFNYAELLERSEVEKLHTQE